MAELDITRTLWVTGQQLGTVRMLWHRWKRIKYRLPPRLETGRITLRFKGRGKTRGNVTGDLLLEVQVAPGEDFSAALWISEPAATTGCQKKISRLTPLLSITRLLTVTVPPVSRDGDVIRLPGQGGQTPYRWGLPLFKRPVGDLLVKLHVFSDRIVPNYCPPDRMSEEDLALEGWAMRQCDEMSLALKNRPQTLPRLSATDVADAFNLGGWRALAKILRARLNIDSLDISLTARPKLPVPGRCSWVTQTTGFGIATVKSYQIEIDPAFLHDPFAVTAILAHEFCHVVERQFLAKNPAAPSPTEPKALNEWERKIDMLVFLHQLGGFQLRAQRQTGFRLGYFQQETFERMYVFFETKKQGLWG